MDRKNIDTKKYFIVFLLTTLIFSIGLLLGNYFTQKKLSILSDYEQRIRLETIGTELQFKILTENVCGVINSTIITEELYDIGEKLEYMESELGENDPKVKSLKEYYFLLEIQHWLLLKKSNKECMANLTPILYFYDNKRACSLCNEQGYILTYIREKNPGVRIYSFDVSIHNPALESIKKIYKIHTTPTMVINERSYHAFVSKDELERRLIKK